MSSISASLQSSSLVYDRIFSWQTVTIPIYTQYIVCCDLVLEGNLVIEGTLVIF